MKRLLLAICLSLYCFSADAQVARISASKSGSGLSSYQNTTQPASTVTNSRNNTAAADNTTQTTPKMRGYLRNSGDQKEARNILILKAVVDYKTGDEKLEQDFANLENNREYNKKLEKIMQQLSNKKIRNSKNKEVIQILNDAGNRIYNLLAD
jgi:hypothetical protein